MRFEETIMERRFEAELKDLKSRILAMGGYVEQAIEKATKALEERDPILLEAVHALEQKVNEAHMDIDTQCLEILARLAPVAADLRLILAVIKINTDLERMGDQAVNISYNTEHYITDKKIDLNLDLAEMAGLVKNMVRHSLDAFMRADIKLAQTVLESDDAVDAHKNRIFQTLVPYMQKNPDRIEAALDLILIARNLERMADHATNIAEDAIFASTGEDVRHGVGQNL
jgi:phosphate transport system protein